MLAQQLYEGLPVGKEGQCRPYYLHAYRFNPYCRFSSGRNPRIYPGKVRGKISSGQTPLFSPKWLKGPRKPMKPSDLPASIVSRLKIKEYLNDAQFKLYDLIWKRMVASQMANAIFENTSVDIEAKCPQPKTTIYSAPAAPKWISRLYYSLYRRKR